MKPLIIPNKLSESPAPNYDAWEFRTRISAQSKDLLETLLDNDPEPTTGRNGKIWKAWKSRNDATAELLVKALDDDQLIHIRGLETEPAKMWERLKTVHEKTGVTGSATDLWTHFHTAVYTDSSIPLRNHISTIRSYAEALDRLHSDKPSDTQIIARIFTSLPPSYSTIIKILKNSDKANNLDYITERILAEETTQKSANNFMIHPSGSVNALMATPKSNVICVNPICIAANRVGHTIFGLVEEKKDSGRSGGINLEVSLLIHPLLQHLPLRMQVLFLTMCSEWYDNRHYFLFIFLLYLFSLLPSTRLRGSVERTIS